MFMKTVLAGMAGAVLAAGCVSRDSALERVQPQAAGVDPAAIRDFCEELEKTMQDTGDYAIGSINGFMLLKDGKVIAEGAWSPYRLDGVRQIFSLSKSFTSTAIGFALQEGLLTLDDKVVDFFPGKVPPEVSPNLAAMTVRDLLTMQTGHRECVIMPMFDAEDMVSGFLAQPVEFAPGTHFVYNNGATYMLSAIITRLTGESLRDYLTPRLFEPLGIATPHWEADDEGVNFGAWGLHIDMEAAAKFGQLYLDGGRWQGIQLLDPAWVADATAGHSNKVDPASASDWEQGYGYQFWRCHNNAYRGDGMLGQYVVVMPDADAVLVMFGAACDMQIPLNALWNILYPALTSGAGGAPAALPELRLEYPEIARGEFLLPAGTRLELEVPEGNELEISSLVIEVEADRIVTTLDGGRVEFGIGQWLENPAIAEEEFPFDGPFFGRAILDRPDRVTLTMIAPDSAGQNFFSLTFDGDTVDCDGFWNYDNRDHRRMTAKVK